MYNIRYIFALRIDVGTVVYTVHCMHIHTYLNSTAQLDLLCIQQL